MKKTCLTVVTLLTIATISFGTHLKGGYIKWKLVSSTSRTYEITIIAFTNTSSPVLFGGPDAYLNVGGDMVSVPETQANSLGIASFTTTHSYPGPGNYIISYQEPNRNAGIINMDNSVNTLFYLETILVIDPSLPNSQSPGFLTPPVFRTPIGSDYAYGITAVDPDDHQLIYEVSTPQQGMNQSVTNYKLPENFVINPFNGLITWDTRFQNQFLVGEYSFAIKISQFEGNYLLGYTILDFTVVLEETEDLLELSHNKTLDTKNRIFVPVDAQEKIKLFFENAEAVNLQLTNFTELTEISASLTTYDSVQNTRKIKVGVLTLTNTASIERTNPYLVTVRGTSSGGFDFSKDIAFMFFTKDVDITEIPIVLGTSDDLSGYSIYPNPFQQFVKLSGPGKSVRLVLYDLQGHTVFNEVIHSESIVQLNHLAMGLYIFRIMDGSKSARGKIVKE